MNTSKKLALYKYFPILHVEYVKINFHLKYLLRAKYLFLVGRYLSIKHINFFIRIFNYCSSKLGKSILYTRKL